MDHQSVQPLLSKLVAFDARFPVNHHPDRHLLDRRAYSCLLDPGGPVSDDPQHRMDQLDVHYHGVACRYCLLHPDDARAALGASALALRDPAHLHELLVDWRERGLYAGPRRPQ